VFAVKRLLFACGLSNIGISVVRVLIQEPCFIAHMITFVLRLVTRGGTNHFCAKGSFNDVSPVSSTLYSRISKTVTALFVMFICGPLLWFKDYGD